MRSKNMHFGIIACGLLLLSGCFGATSEMMGDRPLASSDSLPVTDAYIEYPGPHEKWSGPQTFMIHIAAHESGSAKVSILPSVVKAAASGQRLPATELSVDAVREELARLKAALQTDEPIFHGCLSPVRVKLVRVDGALVERQGCRGRSGWPRVVSEIANHMIEYAVYPYTSHTPNRTH